MRFLKNFVLWEIQSKKKITVLKPSSMESTYYITIH